MFSGEFGSSLCFFLFPCSNTFSRPVIRNQYGKTSKAFGSLVDLACVQDDVGQYTDIDSEEEL
jgi:hypothetical protein